jgi:hypothetical protein
MTEYSSAWNGQRFSEGHSSVTLQYWYFLVGMQTEKPQHNKRLQIDAAKPRD